MAPAGAETVSRTSGIDAEGIWPTAAFDLDAGERPFEPQATETSATRDTVAISRFVRMVIHVRDRRPPSESPMDPDLAGPSGLRRNHCYCSTVSHITRRIGSIEVTAVLDGDFASGPIVEAFPDVPAADVLAARVLSPGLYTEDDRWRLRVRAWLVRHAGGLLLFDTGIGGVSSPTQTWAPVTGELTRELDQIGVGRQDIDTVVISHAHDDHLGGALDDEGAPMFPNARHVIQRADRDWLRDLAPEDEEAAACWRLLRPLADAGILEVIDGNHRINTAVELRHMPGHTPGHQILRIEVEDRRLVLCADTWNHPMQFAHPDWPSGLDNDHAQSARARRSLLAELLSHPGTIIAPTHFEEAFGEVRSDGDGLAKWVPV